MTTTSQHWTEAQTWTNTKTGETITARQLLDRNARFFRLNRMPSLCCSTVSVCDEQGFIWRRNR